MPTITSRNPVRVTVESGRPLTISNASGGSTLYWGPNENVSSSDTSISAGSSSTLTRTSPVWVLSAGTSDVTFAYPDQNFGQQAALTAAATDTVDGTYGAPEATVVENLRTRVNEIEDRLQEAGLIG